MSGRGTHKPDPSAGAAADVFLDFLARRAEGAALAIGDLCAARPELAARLELLWAAHQAALDDAPAHSGVLARRLGSDGAPKISLPELDVELSDAAAVTDVDAPTGTRFRIESELARGGMGAVFSAYDSDLRRRLALKVALRDGFALGSQQSDSKLSRFVEEAQITGQLDHPGIVPVHELGVDKEGRVFFTMRLVRGRDLKRIFELSWSGEENWTRTRVLHVLLKVLEALAYAHTKGVIHRDLKPANVMVGRFGEVYIMDWGVARVMGSADARDLRPRPAPTTATISAVRTDRREHVAADVESAVVTMDGEVIGTPAYMPPEQARCETEKMSPRSDVYSIGAMLYHLLTRQAPFTAPGVRVSPWVILLRVAEERPRPVSEFGAEVGQEIEPELAAICEKAMQREPDLRYPTAEAMKADLEAFLENRVVSAYESGAFAQVRKWVARNRALAAAAALALISATAGLSIYSFAQRSYAKELERKNSELTEARGLADSNAAAARDETVRASHKEQVTSQMLELFTGMFVRQDPHTALGRTLTVDDVLGEASQRIQGDSTLDPEVRSALMVSMAQLVHARGNTAAAAELYRGALEIRNAWRGEGAPESLLALGHLIGVKLELGQFTDALELSQRRIELLRAAHDDDSIEVLRAECALAALYSSTGRPFDAESIFQRVVDLQADRPADSELATLNAAENLAVLWASAGKSDRAIEFLSRRIRELQRTQGEDSQGALLAADALGGILISADSHAEAIGPLEHAVKVRERIDGRGSVACLKTRALLGRSLTLARRLPEAEIQLREALGGLEGAFTADHENCDAPRWDLARVLQLLERPAEAVPEWRRLSARHDQKWGATHLRARRALEHLIESLRDSGALPEARTLADELIRRAREGGGDVAACEELRRALE